MKNEKELNEDILKITMLIQEKYPELSKFITEMPVTVPNIETSEINNQHLSNYYDSLKTLVDKYKEAPENTNP